MTRLICCIAMVGLACAASGCGGGDGPTTQCSLSCGVQSTMRADEPRAELSCGTSPATCTRTPDQFNRTIALRCTYANGRTVGCSNVTFNNLGQITGGTCSGEGKTCPLR